MVDEPQGTLRFEHEHVASHDELMDRGRAARSEVPRSAHADFMPNRDRDPLAVLAQQHEHRLSDLVPLRIERMLQNPLTFFRGSAAIQASDLAAETVTGTNITVSGDAHIGNFGLFASPQRSMVFDLNDFDETAYGPWEWDVKRFVTSIVIAAKHKGMSENSADTAALRAAAAYRIGLRQMFELNALGRYYVRADVKKRDPRFHPSSQKVIDQALKGSKRRTSERVVKKITEHADDGSVSIIEDPPQLTHIDSTEEVSMSEILESYRSTLQPDIAVLLSQYTLTDVVQQVVGIGSMGTRCYIAVLTGSRGEPLVLQIKQATDSALTEFGSAPSALPPGAFGPIDHNGYRVVANQRILQAVSDPFLGYIEVGGHNYYVRQFRDRNVSIDSDGVEPRVFIDYADACGTALARAHAQSPHAAFIAGYLGGKPNFEDAVVQWAMAYAKQSLSDFHALKKASR